MTNYIKINENDNVAVALGELQAGETVKIAGDCFDVTEKIPAGHKLALTDIRKGNDVVKYGAPIGRATEDIKKGSWIHTHNVKTRLEGKLDYIYEPDKGGLLRNDDAAGKLAKSFMGYKRSNGAGIRNEIWIIPTVGCVNHIAEELALRLSAKKRGSIDAVVAMAHPYGCSQMGDDQENTAQILGNLAKHPNCGGALILSLGCENNNLDHMKKYLKGVCEERIRYLVCQDCDDELAEGEKLLDGLMDIAAEDVRVEIPVTELVVGLKCGGSDGFSGITANPLVGRFSDILISKGGSTILTEVPEMFGAETLLMNRCTDEAAFGKTVALINNFKEYYERHNQVIYENPSPGNKAGGITTLEDKSLGCVQKSGSAPVKDVLEYGGSVCVKGLNLLSAPGNDMVASTALAAAGAQLVLFTTGRGTPLSSPVPTMKISTNTGLATRKRSWIDFDAGVLVSEGRDAGELACEFYDYVIKVASGEYVKGEAAGYHSMTIFKQGVTL